MAKTQTPSTDLVVRSSADLTTDGDLLTTLERVLVTNERVEAPEENAEAMAAEIVAQILAAETDEQLMAIEAGSAVGWRELLEVPVELLGFRWRPSDYDEGSSLYFVVFGNRLDNGDPVVLTTGARNVLAQLVNRAKRGTLTGAIVKLVQSEKPTKAGYRPLWLRTVNPDGSDAGTSL